MFKEIKAVFKVSEDTSFIKGEWKEDRFVLKVELSEYNENEVETSE